MTKTTKPRLTLAGVEKHFATEDTCKAMLASLRWPDNKIVCPRCHDGAKVYKTADRYRWKCKACNKNGYKFSVLTGTVFENTNMPLTIWFRVAFLMISSKKGMSALQIYRMMPPSRGTKGSYKTFWYMCMRIRAAMLEEGLLGGIVEMDETYVGGEAMNAHRGNRGESTSAKPSKMTGKLIPPKTGVIGAISRKGNVVARVIEHMDEKTVREFVKETVREDVELVATDEQQIYMRLDWQGRDHQAVRHSKGEYVRGIVHTAHLDQFWSMLKRGIMGSFHHVSKEYLPMYVNEFAWRHNHRNDERIFQALLAGC